VRTTEKRDIDPTIDRKRQVPRHFDRVADRYDLLVSLNPGYRRHLRLSVERIGLAPGARVLDLCCGTGLSTEAILSVRPDARVVALDASERMLAIARRKPSLHDVEWVLGDATEPAAWGVRGPFDAIFMAYGIRNVPDPDRCLAHLRALLRPGGAICFHEYSVADSVAARVTWDLVCWGIIIPLGFVASGDATLFRYLWRSVKRFDGVRAFEQRLRDAGFVGVRTLPMDGWQGGIVHSFLARAPGEERR
jgi:ubiquinone/menaquinone biosynthesis C-methylase UbiE